MNAQEVLKKADREKVWEYLLIKDGTIRDIVECNIRKNNVSIAEALENVKECYSRAFDEMISCKTIKMKPEVLMCCCENAYDGKSGYNIFGVSKNNLLVIDENIIEELKEFGLEFYTWEENLGMEVSEASIKNIDLNILSGEIFSLVSFLGLTKEDNENNINEILKSIKETEKLEFIPFEKTEDIKEEEQEEFDLILEEYKNNKRKIKELYLQEKKIRQNLLF